MAKIGLKYGDFKGVCKYLIMNEIPTNPPLGGRGRAFSP